MRVRWRVLRLSLGVLLLAPARGNTATDFYAGKPIDLIVGSGPGGGYDTYARARASSRRTSSGPSWHSGAKHAGRRRSAVLVGLLGHNPSIQFDSAKFAWLGSASSFASDAYRLIARPAAPVKARSAAMRWSAPSTGSAPPRLTPLIT
jgi:hypothetical protein